MKGLIQNPVIKRCITCGKYFPFNHEYFYHRGKSLRANCKKCHNIYQAIALAKWRKNTKDRIIKYLGGKCKRCGYNRCSDALICHHRNRVEKYDAVANLMKNPRKWEIIEQEINKCDLLCSNCHAEVHHAENIQIHRLFYNK